VEDHGAGYCSADLITFSVFGCEVTVGKQAGLSKVTYHNIGSTDANTTEITAEATVGGIQGENHGFLCPGGEGSFNTPGTYTGNATITGESTSGVMTNVWWGS
jgi:hypothetical protein